MINHPNEIYIDNPYSNRLDFWSIGIDIYNERQKKILDEYREVYNLIVHRGSHTDIINICNLLIKKIEDLK